MSRYKNNHDGTYEPIARNLQIVDAPQEEFVTEDELLVRTTFRELGIEDYEIFEPHDIPDTYETTGYSLDMTDAQFLGTFYDAYLGTNSDGYEVTKEKLGTDESGLYNMYAYDFKPKHWTRLILLTSGCNAMEFSSMFGLAYFIKSVMESHESNSMLDYIYKNVRIKVIPLLNPWGFNQTPNKTYTNANSISINRNFDYEHKWDDIEVETVGVGYPNDETRKFKGAFPFSEKETINWRKWLTDNLGAEFYIDCHTGHENNSYDLYDTSISTSAYASKISAAHNVAIAWIKSHYSVNTVDTQFIVDSPNSVRQVWSEQFTKMPTLVLEQSEMRSKWYTNGKYLTPEAILSYCTVLFIYISEFLKKPSKSYSVAEYIEKITQRNIRDNRLIDIYNDNTPKAEDLTFELGSIANADGSDLENDHRIRTDLIPITDDADLFFSFSNNFTWLIRCYDENKNYITIPGSSIIVYHNDPKQAANWTASYLIDNGKIVNRNHLTKGSGNTATVKYIRLVGGISDDPLDPSTCEGITISVTDVNGKRIRKLVQKD